MSASEDSEVDENFIPSSDFTSYQPAQVQILAPAIEQSSDPDLESELPPDIDQDHHSDDGFLSSDADSHDWNAERSHDHGNFDKAVHLFAADESYYTRPNRYYGPPSTWRSWTKAERDVAESLELDRAQDLSVHLYNARVLRLHAQNLRDSSYRKRRRATSESDSDEDEVLRVPKIWTAWPMPPNEAPRKLLARAGADTRPSRELEDCLISTTARTARERWNTRECHNENEITQQMSAEERDQQGAAVSDQTDHDDAPKARTLGPHAFAEDEPSPVASDDAFADDLYEIDPIAQPVPLADDEKVRTLLLPSTRHVISNLDRLLLALHSARQYYASPILTDEDDKAASSATGAEGQSSASSGKRRRHARVKRASSISTVDTETSVSTLPSRRKKGVWKEGSVPRNRKFRGLGLRDWSDVLGMAALTGWDEDVVARASKRCTELFGEDMLFRKFHEVEHGEEKSFFTERLASGEEPPENWEATHSRTPRKQGMDEDDGSHIEDKAEFSYPCPVETCPRHEMRFCTAGNLKQHMAHSHAQFEAVGKKEGIAEAAISDTRKVLCPIQACHRSREPFTRGSKLYLHVRKMHPEVNLEDLKKLESQRRGETRGKWTGEKRKRNPYERD